MVHIMEATFVLAVCMANLVSARRLEVMGSARSSAQEMSSSSRMNETGRSRYGGYINVGPLFEMWGLTDKGDNLYTQDGHEYKCCCDSSEEEGKCQVADVKAKNTCDDGIFSYARDRNGCGCLVNKVGWKSFQKLDKGVSKDFKMCRLPIQEAIDLFQFSSAEDLQEEVKKASTSRKIGNWEAEYGECSTACGTGLRTLQRFEPAPQTADAGLKPIFPTHLGCTEMKDCNYKCDPSARCGWGQVHCDDGLHAGSLCKVREILDPGFPTRLEYRLNSCFVDCDSRNPAHQRVNTMCAVTTNHLDEQYGSLVNLLESTCRAGEKDRAMADMVVLMTQELNHANKLVNDIVSDDFGKYVKDAHLPGYRLAGVCAPQMSANSAVFIREGLQHHIFSATAETADWVNCSGEQLRGKCDWTNCKGTSVLGLYTTNGMLVVGNWHGARGSMLEEKRVKEFDEAAAYIMDMKPWHGKKHVVWGGDTNVRSSFPTSFSPASVGNDMSYTPEEIHDALGTDILGRVGVSVDDHLSGKFALTPAVGEALKRNPLYQAKDWDKLCPTYKKTNKATRKVTETIWDGTYVTSMWGGKTKNMIKVVEEYPNLACRSSLDQLAGPGQAPLEYTDFERPRGAKSRAPSWTERIFLSEELYRNCGKMMKDIRNQQDDHDPAFVKCTMPK